jgi:AcrR family transcriptional regulator
MSGIREKQLQKRKQETLDVAVRLLLERGYSNLNMDELAEEAGISKPTLYQYFNSKDELVAKAVERMFEKMEEQISTLSDKSPGEQLEHFLRTMLKARSEKRYLMAPADIEIMRSMHQNYPSITAHLRATKNKLDRIVRQGQAVGEIDPSFPSWVVVNAVFSLQRIIDDPFAKDEPRRSDEELAAAIESIVRLFRRGVAVEIPVPA